MEESAKGREIFGEKIGMSGIHWIEAFKLLEVG